MKHISTVRERARLLRARDNFIEGYASIFRARDMAGDIVMPGAFRKALARRGPGNVRMLFQHNPNEVIGTWTAIREDAHGLLVHGVLLPEVQRARELLALIAAGSVNGLSIGYKTQKASGPSGAKGRHLIEVDLWEISIVTFPMLPGARIARPDRNGLHHPINTGVLQS